MARALFLMGSVAASFMLVLMCGSARAWAESPSHHGHGHILISDQYNNRVIEVDVMTHKVVWSFGNGSDIGSGLHSVVGVNDAERVGLHFTLDFRHRHSPQHSTCAARVFRPHERLR